MNFEWYDKLVDFAKQRSSVVWWFLICASIILFSPKEFLKIIYLDKVTEYIGPLIGFIFIISLVLAVINLISYCIQKYSKHNTVKARKALLEKLVELQSNTDSTKGFGSQQECLQWANKVAPLLEFNQQYYRNFVSCANRLNTSTISGQLAASCLNTMNSQLNMAIEQLRHEVES